MRRGVGFGRRSFSYFDAVAHLSGKVERVFDRVAKDAGNPSGAGHFTILTALRNKRCDDNEHKYDEARSFAKSRLVNCIPEAVPTNKRDYSPRVTKRSPERELERLVRAWGYCLFSQLVGDPEEQAVPFAASSDGKFSQLFGTLNLEEDSAGS
jgi:hypothetical protein